MSVARVCRKLKYNKKKYSNINVDAQQLQLTS